ncbi:hypothetical protein SAMN05444161_0343 [Rhizobiales bacterium GAS191]|nr:hypothetical protein SAMN05519103_07835 [Rhizobiales bacterium GAS113]SEC02126.1 hypothetical protein SAMN05444161_0343 [Rhizobiales bacterium GAS191]SED16924.1 hypothetical protein SAMN05519104_2947 [Rhizobiales bacterium GAS188]
MTCKVMPDGNKPLPSLNYLALGLMARYPQAGVWRRPYG